MVVAAAFDERQMADGSLLRPRVSCVVVECASSGKRASAAAFLFQDEYQILVPVFMQIT
jgi:hypothetical protein